MVAGLRSSIQLTRQTHHHQMEILEIFQHIISYYMETETSISAERLCLSKGFNTIFIRI